MAKAAKKKDEKLKGDGQRKHNRATKGNNTTKRGPLWSVREHNVKVRDEKGKFLKDKDGKFVEVIKTLKTYVPIGIGWNPELMTKKAKERGNLPEPFDALHLSWADEMAEYVSELNDQDGITAKVNRVVMSDGRFKYEVVQKVFGKASVLWSIESEKNINFGSTKKKFTKK